MQTSNRFFDDMARIAGGAMQTITGLREEIELRVKERVERMLSDLDLVNREDFDAVKAMAVKARDEQETLQTRIDVLERELSGFKSAAAAASDAAPPPARKTKPGGAGATG